jgi:hypothetical protein
MIATVAIPTNLVNARVQAQEGLAEQLHRADQSTIEDMGKHLQAAEHYAAIVASLTAAINCPEPPVSAALARQHTAGCAKWDARARAAEEKLKHEDAWGLCALTGWP